jgi:hypothetical protein
MYYGPHRRLPDQLLEEGARHGVLVEGGSRITGPLSTTLHNIRVVMPAAPRLVVEIDRLGIRHWPFMTPNVSIEGVHVHLGGDPMVPIEALASAWFSPKAKVEIRPMEISYEHRLWGELRMSGTVIERRGDSFAIEAASVRLGAFVWREVSLSLERRKGAVIIGFAGEKGRGGAELSCFPSEGGRARWLLDVPHGPVRPLFKQLGLDLGDELAEAQAAGSLSLDIPNDRAQPVRGRMEMVVDDWPLFAPSGTEPLLGRTFSLLSNVVASADGSQWELPRAELTMPVFSLAGKGSLQLGREKRLVLEVEGERTCRQLRGLLPPSPQLDEVRHFLEKAKGTEQRAALGIRWDTSAMRPFRPVWRFVPGCGLAAWPQED